MSEAKIFQLLMGRQPQGKVIARVYGDHEESLSIEVKDDLGTANFASRDLGGYPMRVQQPDKGMYIFRAPKQNGLLGSQILSSDETVIHYSEVTTKTGNKLTLIFEENNSDFEESVGPLMIRVLGPTGPETFFRSSVLQ